MEKIYTTMIAFLWENIEKISIILVALMAVIKATIWVYKLHKKSKAVNKETDNALIKEVKETIKTANCMRGIVYGAEEFNNNRILATEQNDKAISFLTSNSHLIDKTILKNSKEITQKISTYINNSHITFTRESGEPFIKALRDFMNFGIQTLDMEIPELINKIDRRFKKLYL